MQVAVALSVIVLNVKPFMAIFIACKMFNFIRFLVSTRSYNF